MVEATKWINKHKNSNKNANNIKNYLVTMISTVARTTTTATAETTTAATKTARTTTTNWTSIYFIYNNHNPGVKYNCQDSTMLKVQWTCYNQEMEFVSTFLLKSWTLDILPKWNILQLNTLYLRQSQAQKNTSRYRYPNFSTTIPATSIMTARPRFCIDCILEIIKEKRVNDI